jgi:transcriptional regulator with XRE-family HTH domain
MRESQTVVKRDAVGKSLTHAPQRLKYRRVAAGLSITELATLAGYSKGHLSMLEDGKHHSASATCLKKLAEVLGCEITDLMPTEPTGSVA